jgi:hypothetical protein
MKPKSPKRLSKIEKSDSNPSFASGGNTRMFKEQTAGPAKPGMTGKKQSPAPGAKAAKGGDPPRAGGLSNPARAGRTGGRGAASMTDYLTQADVSNCGHDLVDFSQRAAVHALSPHLQQLQQQNAQLQRQLAVEARRNLDQRVERAVPNYREIDRNPQWHRWLLGIDELIRSGRSRPV